MKKQFQFFILRFYFPVLISLVTAFHLGDKNCSKGAFSIQPLDLCYLAKIIFFIENPQYHPVYMENIESGFFNQNI